MINWGSVPAGSVLPFPFTTYGKTNGESITLSGLAVTDIEVYKGTSMTQRSSDAGYALMDTDGIDIDGVTGFHGFSIDTGDNTDSGFYAAGSYYTVLVSAITVDSQTVSFIAGTFRLVAAESTAGTPKADVSMFGGTAGTFSGGRPEVNATHAAGTAWNSGAIGASTLASDTITAAKVASDVTTELQNGLATASALSVVGSDVLTNGTVLSLIYDRIGPPTGADVSTDIANLATVMDKLDTTLESDGSGGYQFTTLALENGPSGGGGGGGTDWTTDEKAVIRAVLGIPGSGTTPADPTTGILDTIRDGVVSIKTVTDALPNGGALTSLATAANLATVAGYLDTEIAAILTDTNELQTDLANGGRLDLLIDAIKAKTDQLTFTKSNEVDVNIQSVNGVTVNGTGAVGDEWGP